jgi:chromosome segregation ATPase
MAEIGCVFATEVCISVLLFCCLSLGCYMVLCLDLCLSNAIKLPSLEGQVLDLAKKLIDQVRTEKSSLMLKCRSIEDRMGLLNKQLEASEKYKSEYLKRYEDAIKDKKKLADEYMSRITNLQGNCSSLEERCSSLLKALDSTKQESSDWKRKYEQVLSKQRAKEDQAGSEIAVLKSRSSAAEARLGAAQEQAQSAQEEAEEWKRKYDIAVREAKAALEKAAVVQERTTKHTQQREDVLREEFSCNLAEKVKLSLTHTHIYQHMCFIWFYFNSLMMCLRIMNYIFFYQ